MKGKNLPRLREKLSSPKESTEMEVSNKKIESVEQQWHNIPQEAKDAYWIEFYQIQAEVYKNMPTPKGIMYYLINPGELNMYGKALLKCEEAMKERIKELNDKHFGHYFGEKE